MFNSHHNQIIQTIDGEKQVSFRYQNASGKWKQALHYCSEYEEMSESNFFIRFYVRVKEKAYTNPMFLVLVPSKRYVGLSTYVGFHGIALLNAYLEQERLDIAFTGVINEPEPEVRSRGQRITRLLPADIFPHESPTASEVLKWGYTIYMKHGSISTKPNGERVVKEDEDIPSKTVHGFRNRSEAIAALRKEVAMLKELHELKHGWRDACPIDIPKYIPIPRKPKKPRNRSKFKASEHPIKELP